MRVLGYTWAGVRTSDLKSAKTFFGEVLGLSLIHEGQGMIQFEMPSGQLFEIFDSTNRYFRLHACPVFGFPGRRCKGGQKRVAVSRGTDTDGNESEAWTYFRGPDGYLYEIWQTTRPLTAI